MTLTKYSAPNRGPDLRKTGTKTWQVGHLWEMHHEVIRLIMLGMQNKDIAERLDVTPEHISGIRNSKIVQDRLVLMTAARDVDTIDIAKDILKIAPKSLKLLEDIIGGEGQGKDATIGLRARVAESNLDRSGFGAPKKVIGIHAHGHYTGEEIEELKRRANMEGDIVDIVDAEVA